MACDSRHDFFDDGPRWNLGGAARIRLLAWGGIHRIEADAGYSRCAFHQRARELATLAGHHGTRGQGKAQGICLILEVENNLSRHRYFSLGLKAQNSPLREIKPRRLDEVGGLPFDDCASARRAIKVILLVLFNSVGHRQAKNPSHRSFGYHVLLANRPCHVHLCLY